jgi:hypothetical protein
MSLEESIKYQADVIADGLKQVVAAVAALTAQLAKTQSAGASVAQLSQGTQAIVDEMVRNTDASSKQAAKDAAEADRQARLKKANEESHAAAEAHRKEQEAKKTTPTVAMPAPEPDAPSDTAPLDYEKDVKPVLLQVNRAKGRDALAGLLKQFGAPTGDKLPADKFAEVLAAAEAVLAGK